MVKKVKMPGRIESTSPDGIVTGAAEIFDDGKGKKQNVINTEVSAELLRLENEKQDNLSIDNVPTEGSRNPVTSGGVFTAEKALSDAIEAILILIPSAATALNQLADKSFVESSLSTATATFRGTYNVVSDLGLAYNATHEQIAAKLGQVISTADNNDYCFVQVPESATSTDINHTERYKFNGSVWAYEYDLNNSGFTADQWAAINSNITAVLVEKLTQLPTAEVLATLLAGKQDNLTFDNRPTAGSDNPVKSGGVYASENEIIALINALEVEKQDKLTFDSTPTNGSSNPVTSGGVYEAIYLVQVALASLDNRVISAEHSISVLTENVGILRSLYQALTLSDIIVGSLPATGVANTVYRVPGVSTYADWMYYNGAWVKLAEYTTLDGYLYKGVATPSGSPAASAVKMFYFALTAGTYTNFGCLVCTEGINILKYDGANWTKEQITYTDGGVFDISAYHATGGTLATYSDLSAALDSNNGGGVPQSLQKGGMSVKFVRTSDNKYVQYRLMADEWSTTVTDWQGVDTEPVYESKNLISSGAVYPIAKSLNDNLSTQDNIQLPSTKTVGLVPYSGSIVRNNNLATYYAKLSSGDVVTIHVPYSEGYAGGFYGVTANVPVLNEPLIAGGDVNLVKDVDNKTYTATQDCYIVVAVDERYITSDVTFTIPNNGLAKQLSIIVPQVNANTEDLAQIKPNLDEINENLSTSTIIEKETTKVTGLVPIQGSIAYNAVFDTYYARLNNGDIATIDLTYTDGYGAGYYGVTADVPVKNASLLFDGSVSLLKDVKGKTYTATQDCYLVVAVQREYVTGSVTITTPNNGIGVKVDNIEKRLSRIVIGSTGDFTTIKDGFDYAVKNNVEEVVILPEEFDLVQEGIENYVYTPYNNPNLKQGYYAPKKVYGYGAVLRCELSNPNWVISPINIPFGSSETEIYGLTIICENCRYCIHDERYNMSLFGCNCYHSIFKDLTLIHQSAPSEVLIAPTNIGGGWGDKGYVTIENCVMQAAGTRNVDYHSKAGDQPQSGECTTFIKDCILDKTVTATQAGATTLHKNKMYVTNCLSGQAILAYDSTNVKLIPWNNVVISS